MDGVAYLPLSKLRRRQDARALSAATVTSLAESIGQIGVINPLRVRPISIFEGGQEAEGWEVTAGRHRFEAAQKAGLPVIPCIIVSDDELHAELAMIDENLCRAELSPADRAHQTARRKAIYISLHPTTARGVSQAAGLNTALGRDRQIGDDVDRFTADTSEKTGRAERNIQRDAERGEKVCEEAINLIRGTDLDKGTYLDKLKKLEPEEQVATVNRALSGLARAVEREKAEAADKRAKSRVEADVRHRAAQALAERIIANFPADELDAAKADAFACGATLLATALNNIAGSSIMDRAMGEAA